MSSAEAAPGSSSAAADAADAPASSPPDFLQQRLAAVAAVPAEQRSHDEAGFLRAHELLAAAQESLAALDGPAAEPAEHAVHFSAAVLSFLGGLEELCSIGVPLQWALNLHRQLLMGLVRHSTALQRHASEVSVQLAQRYSGFLNTLSQFYVETVLYSKDTPPGERPRISVYPNVAQLLDELHTQLFGPVCSLANEIAITLLRLFRPGTLPSMAQLRRLWAALCWQWAAQLAAGVARPSWMGGYPGPTLDEAQQLQLRALATMRQLRPSHPLTTRMAAQTRLGGLQAPGPPGLQLVRDGLEHAAAAGGPHGSSMFTAEFSYGLISSSTPDADTPPWGRLTLAESAELLRQGDAALARCKALLPRPYLVGLKAQHDNPSVCWRRTAVERHRQAVADEWREDLLAADPAPEAARHVFARQLTRAGPKCAGCGRFSVELHTCSGCKRAKYCRWGLEGQEACLPVCWADGRNIDQSLCVGHVWYGWMLNP